MWTKKTWTAAMLELMSLADRAVEDNNCYLWDGAVTESGHPIYKPHGCGCTLVRRRVFELCGDDLKPRVPIDTRCGNKECINRAHLFQSSSSAIGKKAAKRGAFSSLSRRIKIAATKRKKGKLTPEMAEEIRNSSESGPVLALKYGVDKSLINNIKRGKAWQNYASPWAALLPANDSIRRRA